MGIFSRLLIENFRNISSADLGLHDSFNLITGENGAGKTNILEALFFLSIGKSQRKASPRDFVNFNADSFLLKARLGNGASAEQREAMGTRLTHAFSLNQNRLTSASELLGGVLIVHFDPDDILLSSGAPSERRRFLNMLLSQADINYFLSLKEYNRTLLQRNAYLKSLGRDARYLGVLTEGLIRCGAQIRLKRRRLVRALLESAGGHLKAVSAGRETLHLDIPGDGSATVQEAESRLEREFRETGEPERALGATLAGPHRDDLLIGINGRPARAFASRGQLRSVALSLKLAAVDCLNGLKEGRVVFLLDDIFSELDERRCAFLFERIQGGCQVFAAVPRRPAFDLPESRKEFRVENGAVREGP